jgi:hypothetical protein
MQVLAVGLYECGKNGAALILFFSAALGAGVWMARGLLGKWKEKVWLFLPLSLIGGVVLLASFSLLFFLLARYWPPLLKIGNIATAILSEASLLVWVLTRRREMKFAVTVEYFFLGCLLFLVLLAVRLAFLKSLLVPPYGDGAAHYITVKDMLSPVSTAHSHRTPVTLLLSYYHYGFHSLVVWLVCGTGLAAEAAIPLVGQLLVVLSALGVLFLVGVTTQDSKAAAFAALLAGFGWKMPAYASNWAKYPTLGGMVVFMAALGVSYISWRNPKRRIIATLGAAFLLAGAVFFHSRILVCLAIALGCFLFAYIADRFVPRRVLPWVAAAIGLLAGFVFLRQSHLTMYYCGQKCYLLGVIALLGPFALLYAPGFSMGIFLYLLGIILAARINLPSALQSYSLTWLDDPFLSITAYIPLSLLGGLGVAGLLNLLVGRAHIREIIAIVLFGLIIFNFTSLDSFYPESYYNYVGSADLDAIHWLDHNLPAQAVFVIAGSSIQGSVTGVDAGVWISPLTGRASVIQILGYPWVMTDALRTACTSDNLYLYVGSTQKMVSVSPVKYKQVYSKNSAKIYRVLECPPGK